MIPVTWDYLNKEAPGARRAHFGDRRTTDVLVVRRKVVNVKAQRLTWPIRSGVVPPLADCYNPRTETGPSLTGTLHPGETVVLCDAAQVSPAARMPELTQSAPTPGLTASAPG